LEDWKIKISVLWLFKEGTLLADLILVLWEPGVIAQIMAGEIEGEKIGPEFLLLFAIFMLVPLVMAFLSLTLKNPTNRWANIILGIVFAGLELFELVEVLAQSSAYNAAYEILMLSAFVALALIVWYAWKSKQKA